MVSQSPSSQVGLPPTKEIERKEAAAELEDSEEVTLPEYIGPYVERRMTHDHAALKNILNDVADLARRHSFETAATRLGEFRIAEERHMNFEDKTLLHIIERLVGRTDAIQQAETEHEIIRRLINAVAASLSAWNLPEFTSAHAELLAAVSEHWNHEEELLGARVKLPDKETVEAIASALRRC